MSAVRNAEAKRVTSIARAINWSYMWRRLMSYVWLDLLLLAVAAAILVYGYNQTLPDGAFTTGWIPGATVHGMSLTPARGWDLTTLTYTVELARTTKTFPLAQDLVTLWPLYLVVVGWQVISVLNMLGGARRVRRTMAPLNDLALRVDELGRMQLSGGKMETLEQAIERASVDSPSVTTGDADLASIEVALNRLLRQMQEAKLQQMRFVNDASHELRTPIAVIQGYVNMLDRWGKDDPDVLTESIGNNLDIARGIARADKLKAQLRKLTRAAGIALTLANHRRLVAQAQGQVGRAHAGRNQAHDRQRVVGADHQQTPVVVKELKRRVRDAAAFLE